MNITFLRRSKFNYVLLVVMITFDLITNKYGIHSSRIKSAIIKKYRKYALCLRQSNNRYFFMLAIKEKKNVF